MGARPRWPWRFWLALAVLVVGTKLAILSLDGIPRIFLGDSGFYLYSSLTGAVPYDRSFTYGWLIRVLAGARHAIGHVVIAQVLASAASALLLGVGLRVGFGASFRLVALASVLATLEPLQLAYERFVMTECLAGLCYAVLVVAGVAYLSNPRAIALVPVAVVGVALLSLRLNAVLTAWVLTLVLPLLAWRRLAMRAPSSRPWLHLGVAVIAAVTTHTIYREGYGHLHHGPAAYYDGGGHFLLGFMSPLVRAEDFPEGMASRILPSVHVPLRLRWELPYPLHVRDSHMWSPDGLVTVMKRQSDSFPASNALARRVAMHAMVRDPLGAMGLGVLSLRSYFDPTLRGIYAPAAFAALITPELGPPTLPREEPLEAYGIGPRSIGPSLTRSWHVAAAHYYPFVLLCPLLAWLAVVLSDRDGAAGCLFVFIVSVMMVATGPLVAASTVIRYLHPLAWLNVLVTMLVMHWASRRLTSRRPARAR